MNPDTKQKWSRAWKITIAIYCVSGITLWQLQDSLLFHPTPLPVHYQFQFKNKFRELLLPLNEHDRLSVVQFYPLDSLHSKGVVLYFHGNRENVNRYARFADDFLKAGYEVWMMDYPGYGKSKGERTEQRFYNDADLLYQMALKQVGADSIIIYGKSLGTGAASQLASEKKCKRLILETPYHSIPSLAWFHFPVYPTSYMVRFQFPVYNYLPEVKAPVTIFHGTRDQLIPYRYALDLKEFLKPGDEFVTIKGGSHNDLANYNTYHQQLAVALE